MESLFPWQRSKGKCWTQKKGQKTNWAGSKLYRENRLCHLHWRGPQFCQSDWSNITTRCLSSPQGGLDRRFPEQWNLPMQLRILPHRIYWENETRRSLPWRHLRTFHQEHPILGTVQKRRENWWRIRYLHVPDGLPDSPPSVQGPAYFQHQKNQRGCWKGSCQTGSFRLLTHWTTITMEVLYLSASIFLYKKSKFTLASI